MENYLVPTITVSSYNGNIPLAKELLNVLDLPNEGILWKKTDQEYILFSEKSWNKFVQKMKAET